MRADIHELLVERPRWGHQARYPRAWVQNRAGDDPPLREALSRSRYGDKHLSENFAPLVRFLRSNVGRPWDKVHSEMASVLAPSNAVQRHVLDHLEDFLLTRVSERDGVLWAARRGRRPAPIGPRPKQDVFYVHPRSGLLCVVPRRPRQIYPHFHDLTPTKQLRRLSGLWYLVTLTPMVSGPDPYRGIDVVAGRRVHWEMNAQFPELRDLWESGRYVIARRQVGKREMAELLASRA